MLKNRMICVIAATLTALAAGTGPATAAPQSLGTFGDWSAFSYDDGNGKVCFVISEPKSKKLSRRARRGDVFFMVTHWTAKNKYGEPSVIIGYPFKKTFSPTIKIGSDSFRMKVNEDGAWIEDNAEERKLIETMKAGVRMTVTGMSRRGTRSTDRYSLSGVTAALDKIDDACGREGA
ncbi:MAG: invasion associated locus B family protein [Alphaproteobacteria bacterium]